MTWPRNNPERTPDAADDEPLEPDKSGHVIRCRARVHERCYDGRPTEVQFDEDLPMSEDGTWDGETIVCDACYVALMPHTASGRGLRHELDGAIAKLRAGAS